MTNDSTPRARRSTTTPGPKPGDAAGTAEQAAVGPARILVVEDNYFVALTIENTLLDAGYEVMAVVDSGEAALERVAEARPDLVLMDIRLAGKLDGIETAVTLHDQGIVSLFASAHFDAAMKARGAKAEPAGWLVKPFSDVEIIDAVRHALEGGRAGA